MSLKKLSKYKLEIILVIPLILYVLGFTLLPTLAAIYYSFQSQFTLKFLSLNNYKAIFSNPQFSEAFWNTIILTLIGLTLEISFGLILALILTQKFGARGIFRAIIILPLGVPTLVSAVMMTYIFGLSGYLNEFLFRLRLIHIPVDWTGARFSSLFTIAIADMWKVTPLVVLLFIAGLEAISRELYEAGSVDGCSFWQSFKYITMPLLKPVITIAVVIRAIDAFRIFDLAMVLAGKTTPVLATFSYYEWSHYHNKFTASAGAVILFLLIIVFMFIYFKFSRETEDVA